MEKYFEVAIKEAKKALKKHEIPVGAVIVKNDKIISKSHNNRQKKYNVLGHAEINCVLKASKKIKDWRLDGCDMYVTLKPCGMCEKILKEARIDNVYFLLNKDKVNKNKVATRTNECDFLTFEYEKMLKNFFLYLRK